MGQPPSPGSRRVSSRPSSTLRLVDGVTSATDAAWLDPVLPAKGTTAADATRDADTEIFSLQHGAGKPLYYSWHKPLYQRFPGQFEARYRHMMYVVRLRHVLIETALGRLDILALEVEQAMIAAIRATLTQRAEDLQKEVAKLPDETEVDVYAD